MLVLSSRELAYSVLLVIVGLGCLTAHIVSKLKVAGSNPAGVAISICPL